MEGHLGGGRSGYRGARMRGARTGGARKPDQDRGSRLGGALDGYRAAVILNDFADNGQSEARAVGLAGTYERIEYVIPDAFGNAATLIDYADFEGVSAALDVDGDFAFAIETGFAGVPP